MTISAISSASSNPFYAKQTSTQQSFSTLVSALQSGDLSAAQSAYASFTQTAGQGDPNSPFAQAINQIGQDLQSGNIGAAQQTLSSLQQAHSAHRHHHHHGGGSEVSQLLGQLGQSLQSGNLAAAQQQYSSFQSTGLFSVSGARSPGAVSLTA